MIGLATLFHLKPLGFGNNKCFLSYEKGYGKIAKIWLYDKRHNFEAKKIPGQKIDKKILKMGTYL